jgi:LmbE family N-acetylglucosaminyl deacetylase
MTIEPVLMNRRQRYSPHSELFGSPEGVKRIRCAVVVAHPNDEIVGAGCLISKISPISVLHVSDGVSQMFENAYLRAHCAETRRRECIRALNLANVPADNVVEWQLQPFMAPYQLEGLSEKLLKFFRKISPEVVLTHAYEGGHPDHDATAFAVHAAVRRLLTRLKPPAIYEMAIYPGNNGLSKVPEFLFDASRESTTLVLDATAVKLKRQMFECFTTQREVMANTPLGPEKFREAPIYDFRLPPHFGKLHYEKLEFGITGKEWRSLARQALKTLNPRNRNLLMPGYRQSQAAVTNAS